MTDRNNQQPVNQVRSGRRFAVDIESPRDKTVCFTVSEEEQRAIDALAATVQRTRSAVLVRIVNAFVSDAVNRSGADNILQLLQEMRSGELPRETLKRDK